jgi:hypothetical protein
MNLYTGMEGFFPKMVFGPLSHTWASLTNKRKGWKQESERGGGREEGKETRRERGREGQTEIEIDRESQRDSETWKNSQYSHSQGLYALGRNQARECEDKFWSMWSNPEAVWVSDKLSCPIFAMLKWNWYADLSSPVCCCYLLMNCKWASSFVYFIIIR